MPPLKVFIGFDERESIAYDVCKYSIERKASIPVEVVPIKHRQVRRDGLFWRQWITHPSEGYMIDLVDFKPFSTQFSHTRFLVPELMNFDGWALFLDSDMVFTSDIAELVDRIEDKYALMCVKHNYRRIENTKMDNMPQQRYHRKNWSSFMLMNCGHPSNRRLNKTMVNQALGSTLHAFDWLNDEEIGHIGTDYNWIEGISPAGAMPKVIHYTLGGPWFDPIEHPECQEVMYADVWINERDHMQRYGGVDEVDEIC